MNEEDFIFGNLPGAGRRRRRPADDDLRGFRERPWFEEEGPLRARRGGGPPISVTPPPVTSVWSAADAAAAGMALSNGGLTVTGVSGASKTVRSSIGRNSGRLYAEVLVNTPPPDNAYIGGLADSTFVPSSYVGTSGNSSGFNNAGGTANIGAFTLVNVANTFTFAANDVISFAADFTARKFWIGRNNVWVLAADPGAGTNPNSTWVGALTLFVAVSLATAGVFTIHPTAVSQTYAPPSGFSAWG